jgi:Flp pilus assembly pilin Flp
MSVGSVIRRLKNRARSFSSAEDGIAITEYGMLISLMVLALVAVLAVFGPGISSWFATKTSQITTN